MRRLVVTLDEKGLQPALPAEEKCLRILGAEVKQGLLVVVIEVPDRDKE